MSRAEEDDYDVYVRDRAKWTGEDEFDVSVSDEMILLWNRRHNSRNDMIALLAYSQGISEDEADLWLSYDED